ncbi:MAG: redoxin domain-containing protein [Planctomycetales bacterium]|nr:redoxin domain-containing protein [Planctomycetales bacterium]
MRGCLVVGLLAVLGVVGFCVTPVPFALAMPAEEPTAETNRVIAPFELTDFAGVPWRLEETLPQPLVVVFVGIECPIVNLSIDELNRIEQEFGERVSLVLIDSNQQDSLLEMEQFARQHELTMPLLKDPGNKVADSFQATRTPEVFLLDRDRQVRYHGQINDRYTYGFRRDEARHHYLVDAIEALTTDQDISVPSTEPLGCHIGRLLETQADAQVTYCGEVAAILQKHCLKCHRDGEIGPFAMDTYEEVVGWAEMIAEVVEEERMPPWHASPEFGHFSNDSRLTEQEKRILFDWVNAGAPLGDLADLPPAPRFTDGWQISEPDLVVEMAAQPIELPATGEIPYRYFAIDPGFTEDKWIQQAECRAGNRAVVHHIIVAVDPPGDDDRQERRELGEWLCATAPGARPMILPPGHAKRIPAGSKLIFQMHYTPNGKPATDLSSIGLVFVDAADVTHEVVTGLAINTEFRIPAGEANYRVDAWQRFPEPTVVTALFPHMHLRGKSFRYEAIFPDGRTETLLDIPHYDFNWQNAYVFAEPWRFPAGTRLHCIAHFDNSVDNFSNPDPESSVTWGEQTWEEMMIGYFDAYRDDASEGSSTRGEPEVDR